MSNFSGELLNTEINREFPSFLSTTIDGSDRNAKHGFISLSWMIFRMWWTIHTLQQMGSPMKARKSGDGSTAGTTHRPWRIWNSLIPCWPQTGRSVRRFSNGSSSSSSSSRTRHDRVANAHGRSLGMGSASTVNPARRVWGWDFEEQKCCDPFLLEQPGCKLRHSTTHLRSCVQQILSFLPICQSKQVNLQMVWARVVLMDWICSGLDLVDCKWASHIN